MSAEWKTETCETCEFRRCNLCRHGPTEKVVASYYTTTAERGATPNDARLFENACAQWQRATPDKEMSDEC